MSGTASPISVITTLNTFAELLLRLAREDPRLADRISLVYRETKALIDEIERRERTKSALITGANGGNLCGAHAISKRTIP